MGKTKWSILHDLGFAYYILCTLGQKDTKAVKVRFPLIAEKYLEWLSDNEDREKIYNEVIEAYQVYMSDEKSMDDVMDKLGSCVVNIKNNLSEENHADFINDLFFIVNAASPTEAEIGQLNHTADFLDVEVNKEVKNKKESRKTDDDQEEPWTLLHDMCYLYYIVASVPLLKGSRDANIKLRMNAVSEKILEWPSDDINGEHLVQKVKNYTIQTLREGIKVGDKIIELATKIKEYMPEENHSSIIEDLQYIVNAWSPNNADDEKFIGYIAHILGIEEESTEKGSNSLSAANKESFDNDHISAMAYVYFDVVLQNQGQSKDELQAKVSVVNEKLSEWAENSDEITDIIQDSWKAYFHDRNEEHETYEEKLGGFIFKIKDNMSEEQLSMVIADLNDIVSRNGEPHNAEIYMIHGLAETFGVSLDGAQHSAVKGSLAMAINDARGCLTQDTDPPYPGPFHISQTLYEGRFTYMPFPKVVGKGTKYKADDLFRQFTSDEVSKIVFKIKEEQKIPYLVFVKEILETKMKLPNKAPYWFIPFVITARDKGTMLYFFQDGFWVHGLNKEKDPKVLIQCCSSDMISDMEINDGHFMDFVMQPFKKDMPSLTVDADIITTMRVSISHNGNDTELDIAEMHGEGFGPQLEIVEAIWDIWKEVVDRSRGASGYMYDPAIFKAFHSWQEVIDWACSDEKKEKSSAGRKKETKQKKSKDNNDIDVKDEEGKTALMRADEEGDTEAIEKLLGKGADIEVKDDYGNTILMEAIDQDQIEAVKLLIDKGADIEAINDNGYNAIMWAACKGQTDIVDLLISKGANIEASNIDEGETPLLLATAEGHNETVELLLDKGADIEAKSSKGETALILAAYNGHTGIVELLIDRGATIEAKDVVGKTALSLAEEEGYKEIVKLLKKYAKGDKKSKAVQEVKKQKDDDIEQVVDSAASDFLSLDTEPAYPGNFYFLTEKYSTKLLRIKNFYKLSRIGELFRKLSKSEVDCLVKKIKTTNTIPKLNFVREILEEKYTIPEKDAPFWFIPFVVMAEKIGCFFYFGRNGISANFQEAVDIDPCFGWEAAKDVTYEVGFPKLEDKSNESDGDIEISFSVEADPDAEYPKPEETVSTFVLKTAEGVLTINEFHGEKYGSQLLIVKTIWDLWKKVVDYSRGSKIWPQHDKVPNGPEYKYFDSWDGLLSWAKAGSVEENAKKTSSSVGPAIKAGDDATKVTGKNEDQYRQKVKEALNDGVVTDLERTGLDFFQNKLKLSDDDSIRIFEEVLKEMQEKSGVQAGPSRTVDEKKTKAKAAISVKTDEGDKGDKALTKGSRTTYETWDQFEKEQVSKDLLKKRFMPIAKNVHDLIVSTYEEHDMPYEVKYGDGTFSFAVPSDLAKTRTRTCVRFGLLNFKKDSCYIESLYKDADEELPKGAKLRKKDDPTVYFYNFASPDDFEKVAQDIKKNVVKSYRILAK